MNAQQAIQLFHQHSPNLYIWSLAGKHNAKNRQAIMAALHGSKMPQAKCGINAMTNDLFQALGATGDCQANKEKDFVSKARAIINSQQTL